MKHYEMKQSPSFILYYQECTLRRMWVQGRDVVVVIISKSCAIQANVCTNEVRGSWSSVRVKNNRRMTYALATEVQGSLRPLPVKGNTLIKRGVIEAIDCERQLPYKARGHRDHCL